MRWPTWLLAGAVLFLGAAAAADAVRDALRSEPGESAPATTTTEVTTRPEPDTGLDGVIYYTDEECRLHGLQLPGMEQLGGPEWGKCAFSLSPDARDIEEEGAVWSPTGRGKAVVEGRRIAVTWREGASYRFTGSAPAFRGSGRLTFFSRGAIRELPPRCSLTPVIRRCSRIVVPHDILERTARQHPNGDVAPGFLRVSVREMVWLGSQEGPERLAALVTLHVRTVGDFDVLALFERGKPLTVVSTLQGLSGLRSSPGGTYFGVLIGVPPGALLYHRDGGALAPLPFTDVESFEWSPREGWLALATPNDLYIARAESLELDPEPLRRLGIVARDIAWRAVFVSL